MKMLSSACFAHGLALWKEHYHWMPKNHPGHSRSLRVRPIGGRNVSLTLSSPAFSVYIRVVRPIGRHSARADTHLTMGREMSAALQKLCRELGISARDAFFAFSAFVIGRLTGSDNLTLLASCSLAEPRNLGWGLIENILPALVSIRHQLTARNG